MPTSFPFTNLQKELFYSSATSHPLPTAGRTLLLLFSFLLSGLFQVVQLEELLEVRHSVFIVGNAGTGKTQVWKTLFRSYQNTKRRPIFNDLNPKAVTNDELFGIINPATREWKDGEEDLLNPTPSSSQPLVTVSGTSSRSVLGAHEGASKLGW